MLVRAHRVHIVVLCDEASMARSTRYFPYSYIVGAEPWDGVVFLSVYFFADQAQAQLAPIVRSPREDLGVEFFVLLSVDI